MPEWLKNLSPRDKVFVLGGGALVLFFLVRTVTGGTSSDAGVLGDQSQATAQAEQNFEQTTTQAIQANNQAIQEALSSQSKALLQMMSGFQESQTKSFDSLETALQSQQTNNQSAISELLSKMSVPVSYPATVTTPVVVQTPTVPTTSKSSGGGISSSMTQYNTIGGGTTDTKPANTTLANGNTIKYDNGPHGWTEYNSSGQAVRAGTASPY